MREILVLNAGSSSLKFAVFEQSDTDDHASLAISGQFGGMTGEPTFEMRAADGCRIDFLPPGPLPSTCETALGTTLDILSRTGRCLSPVAVGHRLVHGGPKFFKPTLVDDATLIELDQIVAMAPLHMPAGLRVLKATRAAFPGVPQVACFDTAFHASQPPVATTLALPREYAEKGYRRYGFHGLNYEHVVVELPRLSGKSLPRRLLACHLGNGASLCAIRDGRSVATTMGFTPLDGLVMGTRSGSIDPGLMIALMRDEHLDANALETLLYRESGLAALSGGVSEMRELLSRNDAAATDAVDAFCYWAARHAGSMIMAMGGIDAIAFTGGMGENAPVIRQRIVDRMSWLGIELDAQRNACNAALLSTDRSPVQVWRVFANEEATIARGTLDIIAARGATEVRSPAER